MTGDWRGRWRAAVRAIGAAALFALSGCSISPEESAHRALEAMEKYEPTYALVRRLEPQTHAELRGFIEQQLRDRTGDRHAFARGIRQVMSRMLTRRLRGASDELVLDYIRLVADETQRLEPHPEICASILLGTAGDLSEYDTPEAMERERRFYRALLTAPARPDLPMATEAELELFREAFLTEAQTALALPEEQVLDALDGIGPPLQICRVTGTLMRRLIQLPVGEAASLFRLLALLEEQGQQTGQPSPFV